MNKNPNKIRVCFIAIKAYPIFNSSVEKVFGGAEVDLYLLATELAKDSRFEVSFVVGDYGQPDGEVREGVKLYKSVATDRFMLLEGAKVWRAMKRADADVYMHEACSLVTTLTAIFCKLNHRIFVYRTAHTNETDGTYTSQCPVRGRFVKWAFRHADVFITQNQQDNENLLRTVGRIAIVIPNTCRMPNTPLPLKNGVLWTARSMPVKRPEYFFDLAKAFPGYSFIMICPRGTGDNNYLELVTHAQQIKNLTFLQHVPFQEIDRYFEQAAVFVNTSDSEGFPNTFVQACKSETPILSLRINPDDFLNSNQCGLCCDGDRNLLMKNLNDLLLDKQRCLELGRNGRRYANQTHNIRVIAEQYKQLFMNSLTQKR